MLAKLATLVGTVGYVGFLPVAPGTFGSAMGLVAYAAVVAADSWLIEAVVLAVVVVVGIWAADRLEAELGKDPGVVVIDEVAGMLVTVAFLNVNVTGAIVAFLVFRVLDVIKPPPAARLENLHGGPGIVFDDVMAGVYGNLVMRGLIAFSPGTFA